MNKQLSKFNKIVCTCITIFHIICILFCISGCKKKDDGVVSERNIDSVSKKIMANTNYWINLWRKLAVERNINSFIISDVSEVLKDELGDNIVFVNIDNKISQDYEKAMNNFIVMHHRALTESKTTSIQTANWLAYCIKISLNRISENNTLNNDYREIALIMKEKLLKQYKESYDNIIWKKWEEMFNAEADRFERIFLERIHIYKNDILFPVFKNIDEIKEFENYFEETKINSDSLLFPKYEEPKELLVSKDRQFETKVHNFTIDYAKHCLCELFTYEVKHTIKISTKKLWSGVSVRKKDLFNDDDGCCDWPILIQMRTEK